MKLDVLISAEEPYNAIACYLGVDETDVLIRADALGIGLPYTEEPVRRYPIMDRLCSNLEDSVLHTGTDKSMDEERKKLTEEDIREALYMAFVTGNGTRGDIPRVAKQLGIPVSRVLEYFCNDRIEDALRKAFYFDNRPEDDIPAIARELGIPIKTVQHYFYINPDVLHMRMEKEGEFEKGIIRD